MLGNGWWSILCLTHAFYLPLVLTARDGQFICAESKLRLFSCTRVTQLVSHASICYTLHPVLCIMATSCILGKSVLLVSYSSFEYFTMPAQSEMSKGYTTAELLPPTKRVLSPNSHTSLFVSSLVCSPIHSFNQSARSNCKGFPGLRDHRVLGVRACSLVYWLIGEKLHGSTENLLSLKGLRKRKCNVSASKTWEKAGKKERRLENKESEGKEVQGEEKRQSSIRLWPRGHGVVPD